MNLRRTRKPYSPPKKRKPLERIGKATGTVRRYGESRSKLRDEAFAASSGFCQVKRLCQGQYVPFKDGEAFHVKSVGAGGSDELATSDGKPQVLWSCKSCHNIWHAYGKSGEKPCPPKVPVETTR